MYQQNENNVLESYLSAKETYARLGVDTDKVIEEMKKSRFRFTAGREMM